MDGYRLECTPGDGYLHFVVAGQPSKELMVKCVSDIRDACVEHGCYRVLLEGKFDSGSIHDLQMFQFIVERSPHALGFYQAFAYVDAALSQEAQLFAETAAVNRGIPVRVFAKAGDAVAWIGTIEGDDRSEKSS